jgi:hypothetical protein
VIDPNKKMSRDASCTAALGAGKFFDSRGQSSSTANFPAPRATDELRTTDELSCSEFDCSGFVSTGLSLDDTGLSASLLPVNDLLDKSDNSGRGADHSNHLSWRLCSCCNRMQSMALQLEDVTITSIRQDSYPKRCTIVALAFLAGLLFSVPFLATGKSSTQEVNEVCEARYAFDNNMEDYATSFVFPMHFWTCAAISMSLFGFAVWMLYSPHHTLLGRTLDRKLGSYCIMRLFSNMVVSSVQLSKCTTSETAAMVANTINLFVYWGCTIIGSNLLLHRYLLEKADVMCTRVMQGQEAQSRWLLPLEKLKRAFNWEIRVIYLVPIALPFYLAGEVTVAVSIGGIGGVAFLATDAVFSVMVTAIFLRYVE